MTVPVSMHGEGGRPFLFLDYRASEALSARIYLKSVGAGGIKPSGR